ncbi:hypothetical protein V7S43_004920 [Phytophthora oleae]|uniref:Nucleotide-diphospho-sugar transferase domain-containing protein n=1 Tax=Phytophthora oleae TaxID=2107226 RepID=A0ABD3FS13_9STRA
MVGSRIASSSSADACWHARLAALLTASGKHDSAASHYRRALRGLDEAAVDGNPEDEAQLRKRRLQWQFELAATETKRGCHQEAIALYEEILATMPECVEVQVNLAAQLAIADASRLEEALGLCLRALTLRPNLAEAHYNRNMLLRRLGRQSEAVRVYWGYIARDIGVETPRESMPNDLARAVLFSEGVPQIGKSSYVGTEGTRCNQAIEEGGVTVVCVKWGMKYGPEYVNKLYNSVMRNSTGLQVAFACLTDSAEGIDPHENLNILELDDGWKGWWNKCQLFSSVTLTKLRALGHGKCFYLDLDTVVVGSMVDLLTWTPPLGVLALLKTDQMANEQREGGFNSSVVAWRVDEETTSLQFIYSFLQTHFATVSKYIFKFDHWLEMAHREACFLEDVFTDQIFEYRSIRGETIAPPPNAAIICFPLLPKPHQASVPWVAQHWV